MSRAHSLLRCCLPLFFVVVLVCFCSKPAHAQTFTVLHNFTGGVDGKTPDTGAVAAAGNFYGTTQAGGTNQSNCPNGCGTVFKLSLKNSNWILNTLYNFTGGNDGLAPRAGLTFGPDGALYGATVNGGNQNCDQGCGTVYQLRPGVTFCRSVLCYWNETVLYRFTAGSTDGAYPSSSVAFDHSGNLYGATEGGGNNGLNGYCHYFYGCGIVYELSPSNGSWTETVLYIFQGGPDGRYPAGALALDSAGDVFGASQGPEVAGLPGSIYELTPSQSGWTKTFIYEFQGTDDGSQPIGVLMDSAGNLYGETTFGGAQGGGVAYELSANTWNFNLLYSLVGNPQNRAARLTMDAAGNLYGTSYVGGQYGRGTVFKLTPSMSGWSYTPLHDFTGGSDGNGPASPVVLDTQGNVYGTTLSGGTYNSGVAFEVTQ